MAVAFDAVSLTPNLNLAGSSASVSHTASGSNRWAIGVVLVRRTSGGAVSVTATYGGVSMDYLGDVSFNNDDPAATNTGCLWFFGLANPPTTAEDFEFTVPIDGSRSGEARGSIRTYTGVGSVGPFQSAAGTEAGTATTIAVPSATGRRAVGAMAHESTSDASSGFAAGGGGTATNVQRLNLNVSGGDAVVADSVGTAGLTFNGNRASGVDYCTCGIDLLEINVGTLTATAQRATFSGTGVQNPRGALAATAARALFSGAGVQNPAGVLAATATPAVAALTGTQGQAGVLAATVTRPIFSAAFGLAIPSSASVFTLSDLTFNLENTMPDKFLGVFSDSPYTMTQIRYPASTSVTSLTTGVVMLDEVLAAEPGQIIILAHGEGARVASRWMRQYEADGPRGALASRLMFILIGNPLSARGGYGIGCTDSLRFRQVGLPCRALSPAWTSQIPTKWKGAAREACGPYTCYTLSVSTEIMSQYICLHRKDGFTCEVCLEIWKEERLRGMRVATMTVNRQGGKSYDAWKDSLRYKGPQYMKCQTCGAYHGGDCVTRA